jgi:hypothetical protein
VRAWSVEARRGTCERSVLSLPRQPERCRRSIADRSGAFRLTAEERVAVTEGKRSDVCSMIPRGLAPRGARPPAASSSSSGRFWNISRFLFAFVTRLLSCALFFSELLACVRIPRASNNG